MPCLLIHVYPTCLMSDLNPNELLLGRLIGTVINLLLAAIVYVFLVL